MAKRRLRSLSIKNKLLIVLSTLPIISIALIVAMATSLFESDKLAYVYDTALSSTQAKSSTLKSQLSSYVQTLKALNINYNPDLKELSFNGEKYFNTEPELKAFLNYKWNGKKFEVIYKKTKKDDFVPEISELTPLLQETWYKGFSVGVSKKMPMHFYLAAKSGESADNNISVVLIESVNFFSLFGEQSNGQTYLFHPQRGRLVGQDNVTELQNFLKNNVFGKKFNEGVKDFSLKEVDHLVSYSKADFGDLYVVSILDKEQALIAVKTIMKRSVLFSFVILCILIIIGVFASNTLTKAIRSLADATGKIMDGDFTVRVEPKSGDEIGVLAQSFNKMTEEVSRLMDKTAENARMEAELKTAHTVQETLFPKNEAHLGPLSIYGKSEPATECGGDWWHYSHIEDKVYVWIGDATGHGVPAALLTSAARAVASVIEGIEDVTPGNALKILNKAIYSTSKGEMMMTFFLGCFDLKNNTFSYSNASHDPPFLLSHKVEGKPKRKDYFPLMENNNPRLGENEGTEYKNFEMKIDPGDKIIFYTDGIVDVKNPEGEFFGERRFLKSMSAINDDNVAETVGAVFETMNVFRNQTPLEDDVTLVVVEFEDKKVA